MGAKGTPVVEQTNNRTIAKNTLMLYGRAILMMLIGLYTSRVILQTLGVTDFGIYNAVGGILGMFGFISSSLSNSTSRFITIAIGKGDQDLINKTFGNIKIIYYGLCVVIVILGETIGLWFLYNKMTIPAERMDAAFWVYQYTILSAILSFICVPYNAAIVAHERMSAFAYISLMDAVFKLLICYLLLVVPFDHLVVYATLLFVVGVIDRVIYAVYCSSRFEEVHAKPRIFKEQFRGILTLSGWTLTGDIAWILNTQGINLLLNIFFGPVVNAARGIALQVQGVMGQFVANFQTAVNPQITKSYARGDFPRMHELFILSSKYSSLLMLMMNIPVFIEAPVILKWWLRTVPDNTVIYLRIILAYSVLGTLFNPMWISIMATGQLKEFQKWNCAFQFMIVPSAYIAFKFIHADSYWVFLIMLICGLMGTVARAWVLLPLIKMKYRVYLRDVVLPLTCVLVLAPLAPAMLEQHIGNQLLNVILVTLVSLLCSFVFIWFLAMKAKEKTFAIEFARKKLLRK